MREIETITPTPTDKPAIQMEHNVTFAARMIRTFARKLLTEHPSMSAQSALAMIADILDGGSSAMECQVVPIRGFVEDGQVVTDIRPVTVAGGIVRWFR